MFTSPITFYRSPNVVSLSTELNLSLDTDFVDQGDNAYPTVSSNGVSISSSITPPAGTGFGQWSNLYNSRLEYGDTSSFSFIHLGQEAWTIETYIAWQYTSSRTIMSTARINSDHGFSIENNATGSIIFGFKTGTTTSANVRSFSYTAVPTNTFIHVSINFNGSSVECFVDGVSRGTFTSPNYSSQINSTRPLRIGGDAKYSNQPVMKMDNIVIVRGGVLRTGNFTPPTTAYPY